MAGRFLPRAGWVSRAWVGDDYVVRLSNGHFRDAFRHEATVVTLLAGSEVPHARRIAHGDGPDGPWYVSERLPGRTLYEAWPAADSPTRQAMIESLGVALRALHRVPVPPGLLPPWLADALAGKPRAAFHPPVVSAALQEDVDVVGLSILSGAHMTLLPRICELLRARGLDDVLVTAGGIIPADDIPALKAAGVAEVFGPGTSIGEVATYLRANVTPRVG